MQEHLFDWQKKESCAVPHENENNIPSKEQKLSQYQMTP